MSDHSIITILHNASCSPLLPLYTPNFNNQRPSPPLSSIQQQKASYLCTVIVFSPWPELSSLWLWVRLRNFSGNNWKRRVSPRLQPFMTTYGCCCCCSPLLMDGAIVGKSSQASRIPAHPSPMLSLKARKFHLVRNGNMTVPSSLLHSSIIIINITVVITIIVIISIAIPSPPPPEWQTSQTCTHSIGMDGVRT